MAESIKTSLSYSEYLQLEGLFTLLKQTTKRYDDIEKAIGEILGNSSAKDEYDSAYPFMDNAWEHSKTAKDILSEFNITIKKEAKKHGKS
ncbi:MAG TPA: hypothetical protein VMW25_00485 [Clostridia bacterium]|nr:hypothetical protein [Clostridia bacterium]